MVDALGGTRYPEGMNLGLPELLVIAMVALLVFGPRRLPELAKGLGKGIRDFKKALSGDDEKDVTNSVPPANEKVTAEKTTERTKEPTS